jgi:hypothetical protein
VNYIPCEQSEATHVRVSAHPEHLKLLNLTKDKIYDIHNDHIVADDGFYIYDIPIMLKCQWLKGE